jgi:hypothetical protein
MQGLKEKLGDATDIWDWEALGSRYSSRIILIRAGASQHTPAGAKPNGTNQTTGKTANPSSAPVAHVRNSPPAQGQPVQDAPRGIFETNFFARER